MFDMDIVSASSQTELVKSLLATEVSAQSLLNLLHALLYGMNYNWFIVTLAPLYIHFIWSSLCYNWLHIELSLPLPPQKKQRDLLLVEWLSQNYIFEKTLQINSAFTH